MYATSNKSKEPSKKEKIAMQHHHQNTTCRTIFLILASLCSLTHAIHAVTKKKRDPAAVMATNKQLCESLAHSDAPLDMTSVYESVENTRNELAKTDKLTPEQNKLLNPIRVAKRMNKILSRIAPVIEKQKQIKATATTRASTGQSVAQSPIDTLDDLPRAAKNNRTTRNCPGGGVARLSSYAICEIRESFHDQQESHLEPIESVVELNNSIVEDISDRLPCKTCDACITQADIAGGTYTINTPGVYCVAENLTATGSHAGVPIIEITSGKTTLDLCGHTIDGGGTGGANVCVRVNHETTGPVTVKNGHVTNAYSADITNGAGLQVLGIASHWRIKKIYATTNANYGIHVYNNVTDGITTSGPGTIDHLIIDSNGIAGVLLEGEYVDGSNYGIVRHVEIANSLARLNGTSDATFTHAGFVTLSDTNDRTVDDISFLNCIAKSNARSGFATGGDNSKSSHITVKNCLTATNGRYGVENTSYDTVIKNLISQEDGTSAVESTKSGLQLDDSMAVDSGSTAFAFDDYSTVRNCSALNGGFSGELSSVIHNCISLNASQGYTVANYCTISNCIAHQFGSLGFNIEGKSTTLDNNIASTSSGFYGFLVSATTSENATIIIKNCAAQHYDTAAFGTGFNIATTSLSGSPAEDCTLIDCVANGFFQGFFLFGTRSSQTVRNCTAASCVTGFENTIDCPTLFHNCTATANSQFTGAPLIGFNMITASSTYNRLLENCSAVGVKTITPPSIGFTCSTSCTLRSNTAVGWYTGFNGSIGSGTPPIATSFFNNLGRGNTNNYIGINLNLTSGYWLANRDSTAPPGGTNEIALSDLTGYWANVADPD